MTFSQLLKHGRGVRSQTEVAKALGVSLSYYHEIEAGRRSPDDPALLRRLAKVLELNFASVVAAHPTLGWAYDLGKRCAKVRG